MYKTWVRRWVEGGKEVERDGRRWREGRKTGNVRREGGMGGMERGKEIWVDKWMEDEIWKRR